MKKVPTVFMCALACALLNVPADKLAEYVKKQKIKPKFSYHVPPYTFYAPRKDKTHKTHIKIEEISDGKL